MMGAIITIDDPLFGKMLRQKSRKISEFRSDMSQRGYETLIEWMKKTLDSVKGLGLAAVQLGVLERVILVRAAPEGHPHVLINPTMKPRGPEELLGVESCLSIPGVEVAVSRFQHIVVIHDQGYLFASDSLARVIQHELDHLDGILMTDRGKVVFRADTESGRATSPV
jgi:peptide deformylase